MRIGYLGNFEPTHSTENHVAQALRNIGHEVIQFQENNNDDWVAARVKMHARRYDMLLWTRTGWDPPIPHHLKIELLDESKTQNIPVVGFHLDRWFGLNREGEVKKDMFFKSTIVFTADGHPAHQDRFEKFGVNHVWMPPGVSLKECQRRPKIQQRFKHDVVFCGSTMSYHNEWNYRLQLAKWLENTYGDRLGIYPKDKPALRGQPLVDLYGSAKVMVGDSCLNGGITNYWSDRIPETLGRGGFLIHPYVEGIEDHFEDGTHLVTYELGNFDELREKIDYYVEHDDERNAIAAAGKAHVMEHHTYERRMEQVIQALRDRYLVEPGL